jgi:sRNA-binding protein
MKKKGNKMVPNCVPVNEDVDENLNQWFKDDWVRIDTQGNIAGKCGTMKKGKKTQRCLPRKKAQSLSKKQRASTSKKKTKSKKQYVSNTKAAGGRKKSKK